MKQFEIFSRYLCKWGGKRINPRAQPQLTKTLYYCHIAELFCDSQPTTRKNYMISEFVMCHVCTINPDSLATTVTLRKKCKRSCTDIDNGCPIIDLSNA